MILAAMALAAHFVAWDPKLIQMGVAVGQGSDEHLILMIPRDGCSAGMKIYSGQYGDFEKATDMLAHSKACSIVDARKMERR